MGDKHINMGIFRSAWTERNQKNGRELQKKVKKNRGKVQGFYIFCFYEHYNILVRQNYQVMF